MIPFIMREQVDGVLWKRCCGNGADDTTAPYAPVAGRRQAWLMGADLVSIRAIGTCRSVNKTHRKENRMRSITLGASLGALWLGLATLPALAKV
jgi:hypothetical protein